MLKIKTSILALVLLSVNSEAQSFDTFAWVPYDGEVPENVARVTTDQAGAPICLVPGANMVRVGWLNEDGICITAGTGNKSREDTEDIRTIVLESPDDEIFEWIPYEGEVPSDAVYSEIDGKAICRAPSAGRVPFRVGWFATNKGHCKTVGDGKNSRKQDEGISMLVARTLPDDSNEEAQDNSNEEAQDNSNEEAQDNSNEEAVDEALDNLSDAMEDLFSTCNWDDARMSNRDGILRNNALERYKAHALAALEDAITRVKGGKLQGAHGSAHSALGKCVGSCKRIANAGGIAGRLGLFIANIDENPCYDDGGDERQLELMESFRDLLTDACTAMDGEWKGYSTGSGDFIDQGSFSDFGLGRCTSK